MSQEAWLKFVAQLGQWCIVEDDRTICINGEPEVYPCLACCVNDYTNITYIVLVYPSDIVFMS